MRYVYTGFKTKIKKNAVLINTVPIHGVVNNADDFARAIDDEVSPKSSLMDGQPKYKINWAVLFDEHGTPVEKMDVSN